MLNEEAGGHKELTSVIKTSCLFMLRTGKELKVGIMSTYSLLLQTDTSQQCVQKWSLVFKKVSVVILSHIDK